MTSKRKSPDVQPKMPSEMDSFTPKDKENEAAIDGEPTRPPTKEEMRKERYGE